MFSLEFTIQPASLYSIRVPYTYQSAITYPLPSPSTVKGMFGNALQRHQGLNPEKALQEVEKHICGVFPKALAPIIISTCTVSNIIGFRKSRKDRAKGKKTTDALLREFAFTKELYLAVSSRNRDFLTSVREALLYSPLYLGDSESLITVTNLSPVGNLKVEEVKGGTHVQFNTPIPIDMIEIDSLEFLQGEGRGVAFHIQETTDKEAPLMNYLYPLCLMNGGYYPVGMLRAILRTDALVVEGKGFTGVCRL